MPKPCFVCVVCVCREHVLCVVCGVCVCVCVCVCVGSMFWCCEGLDV